MENQRAYVLNHERQLVYTSARWSETFDSDRGMYPMLDAALLIQTQGHVLDWDRICAIVEGTWATTALRLMLSYLSTVDLAHVPEEVLTRLAANDRYTNRVSIWLLHQLVTGYLAEGRPLGTYDAQQYGRCLGFAGATGLTVGQYPEDPVLCRWLDLSFSLQQ